MEKLEQENVRSIVVGSYEYIAQDYFYTLNMNDKIYVYIFSVALLGLVSGKKTNDVDFGDDSNIVSWIHNKIHFDINKVLDP